MCSALRPRKMVLSGASARRDLGTLKGNLWGSGFGDTQDPRPATPQKGILAAYEGVGAASDMIGTEVLLPVAPSCQCWAGCSQGKRFSQTTQLVPRGASGLH